MFNVSNTTLPKLLHHLHRVVVMGDATSFVTSPLPTLRAIKSRGSLLSNCKICKTLTDFLANVNSSSCSLYVIVGPSVVCDVRAPYSDD